MFNGKNMKHGLSMLATIGTLALAVRGIRTAIRAERSVRYLEPALQAPSPASPSHRFRIVIPVLHEQDTISDSVRFFAEFCRRDNIEAIYVSSSREQESLMELEEMVRDRTAGLPVSPEIRTLIRQAFGPENGEEIVSHARGLSELYLSPEFLKSRIESHCTTGQVLDKVLREMGKCSIRHLEYQGATPSVARQVMFGASSNLSDEFLPDYIAIYNVDSRPEPSTFTSACRQIDEIQYLDGERPLVLQQSSTFFGDTVDERSAVAEAAGVAQTRWTFANEMVRIRRQSSSATKNAFVPRLMNCVGHGLFVRRDFLLGPGSLPTSVMQEDLAYGLMLSAQRIPVHSMKTLDRASTPSTLGSLNQQKGQWFWAHVEYASTAHSMEFNASRFSRTTLLAQGWWYGILWLGVSPAMISSIILPFLSPRRSWLTAIGLGAFVFWPIYRYPTVLRGRGHVVPRFSWRLLVASMAVLISDSVGPWSTLVRYVTGSRVSRERTARN